MKRTLRIAALATCVLGVLGGSFLAAPAQAAPPDRIPFRCEFNVFDEDYTVDGGDPIWECYY